MKLIIAGSRGLDGATAYKILQEQLCLFVNSLGDRPITRILSGGARGIDSLADRLAHEKKIQFVEYPAMWDSFPGRSAGYIRNAAMANDGDALLAIWNGQSKGTKHMIDSMSNLGKPVWVYQMKGDHDF